MAFKEKTKDESACLSECQPENAFSSESAEELLFESEDEAKDVSMRNLKTIQYVSFSCDWKLQSRPRRVTLLIDDAQEEYRKYALPILANLSKLVDTFRKMDQPIVWSSWSRRYNDGIRNAMDRWYGPTGIKTRENALYDFETNGDQTLAEIKPTEIELKKENSNRFFYHSLHLDMFWSFDDHGKSILDQKLKSFGCDTIILCGLWTDECIIATAYAGYSRGYDVVVVSDAVGTGTPNHDKALSVMAGTCCKTVETQEVVDYLKKDFVLGKVGEYKGCKHKDGRKDYIPLEVAGNL